VKPVVAIVGRPNVGKSTLFNRLTRTRAALVADVPGLTRDRHYGDGRVGPVPCLVIDTGGFDPSDGSGMQHAVNQQAEQAIAESDVLLFVLDARAGLTGHDRRIAERLRVSGRRILTVVNKSEGLQASAMAEFYELGLGEPHPVAAAHGEGVASLMDEALAPFVQAPADDDDGADADNARPRNRVAIVGRPNVGKSTLVNALLGENRMIAFDAPGTTRDAIEVEFEFGGQAFTLIDTAGLRRKRRTRQGIEYYSELRARQAAERADIALVLIDASEGIVEGDIAAADLARKSHCSTLIVFAKWDLTQVQIEDVRPLLERRLRQRPPFITTSAKTGRGISRLPDRIAALFAIRSARVTTGELNRFLGELKASRQPPSRGRKRLNLLYGAQVASRPPRFRFTVNDTSLVSRDYAYWVENELRERFSMQGVPVAIDFRRRS